MILQNILLQAATTTTNTTQGNGPGGWLTPGMGNIFFIVLIIGVFYFFMIRPQMKKQKDQNKFREEIKKGDRIVTIGGIHGKIVEANDKTFVIEVEGQTRLKIEKSAISMENTAALQKANG